MPYYYDDYDDDGVIYDPECEGPLPRCTCPHCRSEGLSDDRTGCIFTPRERT